MHDLAIASKLARDEVELEPIAQDEQRRRAGPSTDLCMSSAANRAPTASGGERWTARSDIRRRRSPATMSSASRSAGGCAQIAIRGRSARSRSQKRRGSDTTRTAHEPTWSGSSAAGPSTASASHAIRVRPERGAAVPRGLGDRRPCVMATAATVVVRRQRPVRGTLTLGRNEVGADRPDSGPPGRHPGRMDTGCAPRPRARPTCGRLT